MEDFMSKESIAVNSVMELTQDYINDIFEYIKSLETKGIDMFNSSSMDASDVRHLNITFMQLQMRHMDKLRDLFTILYAYGYNIKEIVTEADEIVNIFIKSQTKYDKLSAIRIDYDNLIDTLDSKLTKYVKQLKQ